MVAADRESLDLERLARELRALLGRYPEIAAAWIFGSALRGALRFDSDVDVGVLFRRDAADRDRVLADLAARLETLTSPYPADVVDLEPQGVIFAHGVLCDGRRVYEADRDRRVAFESDTAVRAFDFRPTYERAIRGQREGLLRRLQQKRSR